MRLIDADAFKEHLASFVAGGEKAIKETICGNEWIDGVHTAYREIDNMPTVDRPHGEWTEEFDESANPFFQRRWRCSACHDYNYYGRPDFCPCCGAKMRKEGEEE